MRTQQAFNQAFKNLEWYVKFHNKPVWLVAYEFEYLLSVLKPSAKDLAQGTRAILYGTDLEVIEYVNSER